MARVPAWYQYVEPALAHLHAHPRPSLFLRHDLEQLLHLSRRDAIRLLHRFGASEVNDRLEIHRDRLIHRLEHVRSSPAYLAELRRRRRLADAQLELQRQAAARRVVLPVDPLAAGRPAAMLPQSIALFRDRLVIHHLGDPQSLLLQLVEIARTARDDPDGFRAALEAAPHA